MIKKLTTISTKVNKIYNKMSKRIGALQVHNTKDLAVECPVLKTEPVAVSPMVMIHQGSYNLPTLQVLTHSIVNSIQAQIK